MRVLPTIWVHRWSVSQVASHSANGSGGHSDGLKHHLIHVAPSPVLARLHRFYDRMLRRMKVLSGVFVLGGFAAADMPATQTQAQVDPGIAKLKTVFASARVRFDVANLIGVGTAFHGRC